MTRAVGIDLGTTNSVVASITRGRPQVIPSSTDDRDWTPSLVARQDGGFVVGVEVEATVQAKSADAAQSAKRLIGRRYGDEEVQRMIAEGQFPFPIIEHPDHPGEIAIQLEDIVMSPAEVSAQVLKKLRDDAERHIGEPVGHAVITVPAYFRDPSIYATREAGRIAGLRVQHVMPEPTAAALAYSLGEESSGPDVRHVLVYDFGGGTFDVSILLVAPGSPLQVLAVDGDNFLGGDDLDWEIAQRWDRAMRDEYHISVLDQTGMADDGPLPIGAVRWKMKLVARETKERLAGSQPTRSVPQPGLILRDDGTSISPTWTLTRDELASIANPKIERTFEVVERALAAAHLQASDINDVVVVGGSTKLAGVLDQLRQMFTQAEIRNSINPMVVVGIGAAQQTRMALPWACPECGRANDASSDRCLGCGADADQPEHDCESCGAIFSATDSVCPNPGCSTRIVRPEAPVEVLSHAYKVRLVGGDWTTLVEQGTPIFASRREGTAPSAWMLLAASRNGQEIDLPIGQNHDDRDREPEVVMHFKVIDPPADIVAGQKVAVRLHLDGSRISTIDVEIAGTEYKARRVDFGNNGGSVDAIDSGDPAGDDTDETESRQANWYRLLAGSSVMLPERGLNPGSTEFLDELRGSSDVLRSIADRLEAAERAGDEDAIKNVTQEADAHIEANLPIVPTLSMAMLFTNITEDLDVRRDLQAAIEDLVQSLATGGGNDVAAAYSSLQAVMSAVEMPDRSAMTGLDANLLTHHAR